MTKKNKKFIKKSRINFFKRRKNKEKTIRKVVDQYLKISSELCKKLIAFLPETPTETIKLNLKNLILLTIIYILVKKTSNKQRNNSSLGEIIFKF
jgi:hypothetical protein